MNILFVDQFGDLGGAQLCMLDLMPAIVEAGWRVFATVPSGPFAERLRRSGANVINFDAGTYDSGSKNVRRRVAAACKCSAPRGRAEFTAERPRGGRH